MRTIALTVFECGRATRRTVEVAPSMPVVALPAHLRCLGYRLIVAERGRLAVERLH